VRYIELTATVAASDADAASALLRTLADGGGAWVETPFSQPDLESDAIVDGAAPVRVHVYLRGEDADANASLGRMALSTAGIASEVQVRAVEEEDWAEAWKEHFHVERYGTRIVVVPSWRSYDARPSDITITLDPGMAFGTGQHETTRMCLEALERTVTPGAAVLDVGCGSGILSLAAAKLGARSVTALDIDEVAVRVTRENACVNGTPSAITAAQGSLGEMWPFDEPLRGRYDVVVANIIARVIVELAPDLVAALSPSGRLIVSGVIEEREREVVDSLAASGGRIEAVHKMGDWRCIEAARA
jgi:ribosomal protein L11 methyltransferase